ncbi:MAG: amidohydrolase [Thermovirgaceae bacterium]|nr:amidohydrolase [Thermovirgaceae bacterium]
MRKQAIGIKGGSIWTGDLMSPWAEALIIEGNEIVAVGSLDDVKAHSASGEAKWIDAGGATVIPGMTDSHLHLTALSRQQAAMSLFEASSKNHILQMVRERAGTLAPDDWIYGVRFDNSRWPDTALPTIAELDGLGIPNPVLLLRVCAHIHVVNSRALREAGLSSDLSGAGVVRDEKGCFTGALHESFAHPVVEAMKKNSMKGAGEAKALRETMTQLVSEGITSIHTCSAASYGLEENMEAYAALHMAKELPLRIVLYSDGFVPSWVKSGEGDDWFRYGGRKLFLDGSLGGRTAAMTFPYVDDPSTKGMLNCESSEVRRVIREAHEAGTQVQVHAIGDAAIDQFIEALDGIRNLPPLPGGLRHRIVHVQICRPDQMESLLRLGAICDIQPVFVPSDIHITALRIGEERLGWAYAWKDMLRKGLLLTGSSDAPVEPTNPWRGIWAAVTRTEDNGEPVGGWLPGQKLSLDEALALYTTNPPRAVGMEHRFGFIKPGMAADIVILDRDIQKAPPETLREVKPVITMVGGEIKFEI